MSNQGLLVGADVGTTACKAVVLDLDGRELAAGSAPVPWQTVATGAEVEPDAFVDTARSAIAEALRGMTQTHVLGLGIAGMAETGILLDAADRPVTTAIAWHDERGDDERDRLLDAFGDRFSARTGMAPRVLTSAVKYDWLRRHRPEAAAGRRWLGVPEWVVHRLGGEQVAERSLASRTGWLDVHSAQPWQPSLDHCDTPPGFLPPLVDAGAAVGAVRTDESGRISGATLTVAGHDHLVGALGAGALRAGQVFDDCGSAEALVAIAEPPITEADILRLVAGRVTVGRHVVAGRLALLGSRRTGLGLRRVLDLLGAADPAALDDQALQLAGDADGLTVADFDMERAALLGIPHHPTPALVWRAALESSARLTRTVLDHLEGVAGPTKELIVAGGWSRSAGVRATKGAHLGPFRLLRVAEPGARGAALLGGIASGVYRDVDDLPAPPAGE